MSIENKLGRNRINYSVFRSCMTKVKLLFIDKITFQGEIVSILMFFAAI